MRRKDDLPDTKKSWNDWPEGGKSGKETEGFRDLFDSVRAIYEQRNKALAMIRGVDV